MSHGQKRAGWLVALSRIVRFLYKGYVQSAFRGRRPQPWPPSSESRPIPRQQQTSLSGAFNDPQRSRTHLVVVILPVTLAVVALVPRLSPRLLRPTQRPPRRKHLSIRQHRPRRRPLMALPLLTTNIALRNRAGINQIQPVRQAIPALGDLQLDRGNHRVVVGRVEVVHGRQGRGAVGHDDGADVRVGVGRPRHGAVLRGAGVVAVDPARCHGAVVARLDLGDEVVGPGLRVG